MREQVRALRELGPFPSDSRASVELVRQYERLLMSVEEPITDDEARVLCTCLVRTTSTGCRGS
jgi:hypothetical protein